MPLEFYINISNENVRQPVAQEKREIIEKYVWKCDHADDFTGMINSDEIRLRLLEALDLIDLNVAGALDMFNNAVKQAAECMKQTIRINESKRQDKWFDAECRLARQNVRKLLRKFHKTLDVSDRNLYCTARREYKNMLTRKRLMYNDLLCKQIVSSVNNQQEFWKNVRTVLRKGEYNRNNITVEEWYNHFKKVLEKDNSVIDVQENEVLLDE
jgi:hypothetical protein